MTRDPRIDPQYGDIVRRVFKKIIIERAVIEREGDHVQFGFAPCASRNWCSVATWQKWCKNAVVVHTQQGFGVEQFMK